MKKLFLAMMAVAFLTTTEAQSLNTPQPSPTQTLKQNFGLSTIELSYSRPGMKGRKIFGDLVPYNKVWRTGANSATTVTFGDDVTIGETKVKAGKYGLLTIPDKNSWTIIISKQTDVTSPADYKQDEDVVRVQSKALSTNESIETFTIEVANIKPTTCDIQIGWDKTYVLLPVSTDVDSKIMSQIDQMMNKDTRPYGAAALYYMENNKDLNQSLAWYDKAVEQQPKAFWLQYQRATCLAKLGKKAEAKAAAEKSKAMAAEAKNDDYVKLNEKLLAELNK
ncbi:MAG: DUF2911 domain-containing protein [Bacteroidetes bacterium]|nr:DUF2911 domain-containing protein [Bacteroidota bacterium]